MSGREERKEDDTRDNTKAVRLSRGLAAPGLHHSQLFVFQLLYGSEVKCQASWLDPW